MPSWGRGWYQVAWCSSGVERPSQGAWLGPRAEKVLGELLEVPSTPSCLHRPQAFP